jgi:hypothetical protein
MTDPVEQTTVQPLSPTELRELVEQARQFQCVECGWWNRAGRSCCEGCGQEDWRSA